MAIAALLGLAACADMTRQDKNTAIGAGVGAVGGAVLTGGSTAGTLGGAAVGGVIGHEVDPRSERGERDPGSLARTVNQEANMRKLSGSTSSAVVMTAQ